MNEQLLKSEIQRVKNGATRNFGFLKSKDGEGHALAVTPKAVAGAILTDLQREAGNTAKPVVGRVRFDPTELAFIFETKAAPGALLTPLKETIRKQKLPIPRLEVRHAEIDEPQEIVEAPGQPAGAGPASTVKFRQIRIAWDAARKNAHGQVQALKTAFAEGCKKVRGLEQLGKRASVLDDILDGVEGQAVLDALDEGLNATTPEERAAANERARKELERYRAYLETDELAKIFDKNGFVAITARANLLKAVAVLQQELP